MTKLKKISIITATINSEDTIERCIESVLAQNYDCFEHIIVDGGSTDKTLEILQQYSHIKYISEPDKGIADAFNKGFQLCSGDIIGYLNSDDFYNEGAFKKIIPYFVDGYNFVVGKVKVHRNPNDYFINDPKVKFDEMIYHWKHQAFPLNPVGYFYTKDIQQKVGGFNIHNKYAMDLEFLLKASLVTEIKKIEEPSFELGVFMLQGKSTTSKAMQKINFFNTQNFDFIAHLSIHLDSIKRKQFFKERKIGYLKRNRIIVKRKLKGTGIIKKIIFTPPLIFFTLKLYLLRQFKEYEKL